MTDLPQFDCIPPAVMTDSQLAEFCQLVVDGGEVTPEGLEKRVRNAKFLITARIGNELVGTGAIKHPNDSYQQKVFKKSGVDETASDRNLEIGWIYASLKSRGNGIGTGLMNLIVENLNCQFCFATTRTNNDAMKYLLPKFGFEPAGNPYDSADGEYQLSLYLRTANT